MEATTVETCEKLRKHLLASSKVSHENNFRALSPTAKLKLHAAHSIKEEQFESRLKVPRIFRNFHLQSCLRGSLKTKQTNSIQTKRCHFSFETRKTLSYINTVLSFNLYS